MDWIGLDCRNRMRAIRWIDSIGWACVAAVVAFGVSGCTAPRGPLVVTNPDPSVKIPAYKKAVREKDRDAVRQLVADLESDDPAVRLYAINALHRMTGQTLGYRYYDGDEQRRASVGQWKRWLGEAEKGPGGS